MTVDCAGHQTAVKQLNGSGPPFLLRIQHLDVNSEERRTVGSARLLSTVEHG